MFELPSSIGLLATGGIIAAVVAGWSQVKSWLSYASSYIIVKDTISNQTLSREVYNHFRKNYRVLPGTKYVYDVFYLELDRKNNYENIPFKWLHGPNVFFKGFTIYIVLIEYSCITVYGLRGLSKIESIVKEAAKGYIDARSGKHINNFRVIDIMGEEKVGQGGFTAPRRNSGLSSPDEAVSDSSAPTRMYDNDLDKPLIFADRIKKQAATVDPFEGLFYDEPVWKVVSDVQAWFKMKEWYSERSISWRRGICLHGPGGTGKSALITAIAKKLGVPLYRYYLSTMSDQEFVSSWNDMNTPCVVAFEDFDTVFNKRTPLTEHKALTFDCILNEISGVKTKDGVLLMVTTNHLECIDPAMGVVSDLGDISTRPGRIDVTCYLGNISYVNKVKMAERILVGYPNLIKEVLTSGDMTPIQFQELCTQKAYSVMSGLIGQPEESDSDDKIVSLSFLMLDKLTNVERLLPEQKTYQ